MISSACRPRQPLALFITRHCPGKARCYTQQRTARTPRSTTKGTTTNPSPTAQLKNRALPPTASSAARVASGSSVKSKVKTPARPVAVTEEIKKARQAAVMREMEESGRQLDLIRMSLSAGMEPWANKAILLDLRIPSKLTSLTALNENWKNFVQNAISMFRLASDFAFPGTMTKWRLHPQLFRTKSTSESAWIAPFRHELLDVYTQLNQAISSGNVKLMTKLTAYEYQEHAFRLLQRSVSRASETGCTYSWSLTKLLSPVKIVSLRVFPLYHAIEEPNHGNRNCVQALARFETMQTLTVRDSHGQILRPDGAVAEEGYTPEPRRVLEYLICENKMFYSDGWYIRGQMFEGVKPKFKDV